MPRWGEAAFPFTEGSRGLCWEGSGLLLPREDRGRGGSQTLLLRKAQGSTARVAGWVEGPCSGFGVPRGRRTGAPRTPTTVPLSLLFSDLQGWDQSPIAALCEDTGHTAGRSRPRLAAGRQGEQAASLLRPGPESTCLAEVWPSEPWEVGRTGSWAGTASQGRRACAHRDSLRGPSSFRDPSVVHPERIVSPWSRAAGRGRAAQKTPSAVPAQISFHF